MTRHTTRTVKVLACDRAEVYCAERSSAPSVPVPSPPHAATQLAKLGGLLGLSPVAERGLGSFSPPDDDGNFSPGKARRTTPSSGRS